MKLYEKEILIPLKKDHENLLEYFSNCLSHNLDGEIPIRFVVTEADNKNYHCELGILSETDKFNSSIFEFKKRPYENTEKFNVVLIIPTGINAELGGHAGDAGALSRLIASTCDTLITHPNVVNASDINELTENTLYVEGSILSRLMMGTIGLQKVRSNRLEVILNDHEDNYFTEQAINSVSAARATLGIDAEVTILKNRFKMKSKYSSSGRATGTVENLEPLFNILSKKNNYDAIALSSVIELDPKIRNEYFSSNIVNPWGGIEAILTHAISYLLDIPTAHSPIEESREMDNLNYGVVDPRKAAEVVSTTNLHCILKGLHKSPKIITNQNLINQSNISAKDINCLIIPDKCIGLPTLAALQQRIPVIAVKENKNLMKNNLEDLPWSKDQLICVENYQEAVGAIYALKSGTSIESVRRPLQYTKFLNSNI